MLRIGDFSLTCPVALAPMAGITDRVFREIAQDYGVGMVVSEMVASREMVMASPSVRAKAEIAADRDGTAVQIAGREARWMAEAARMIEAQGARLIDINMGCPAKKVTSGGTGAALMRCPELAARLVAAVVDAVTVPVTVKMRLGWDETTLNAVEIARLAVEEGAQAITVHGRTRCQFYKGPADWRAIQAVTQEVNVPMIANGDVGCTATARQALAASGAQAVMIGRAARGAPWMPGQVGAQLTGRAPPATPAGQALADLVCKHYEALLSFYGRDVGRRTARKHLCWYLEHIEAGQDIRARIMREENPTAVVRLLRQAFADARPRAIGQGLAA